MNSICLIILLSSQFYRSNAFSVKEFFERWIFGTANTPKIFLENEQAQNKFEEDENIKNTKPAKLETDFYNNSEEIKKWERYYDKTNFIMKWIVSWFLRDLFKTREKLEHQHVEAVEVINNEPLCHHRFHEYQDETYEICERAFNHDYFKSKQWKLHNGFEKHCSKITIQILKATTDGNFESKGSIPHREARRCNASQPASDGKKEIFFNVYLIAGRNYLEKRRFAFFVLLNADTLIGKMEKNRYWKIFDEKHTRVAAYIED